MSFPEKRRRSANPPFVVAFCGRVKAKTCENRRQEEWENPLSLNGFQWKSSLFLGLVAALTRNLFVDADSSTKAAQSQPFPSRRHAWRPRPSKCAMNRFDAALAREKIELRRATTEVLQLNLGKKCNQTCAHCHVNAGPARREMMTRDTLNRVLQWLARTDIAIVDITGGAPELHPDFRFLVEQCRRQNRRVMDRCNLTILLEPGQQDLAEFLATNEVEIVASMPCYSAQNVDAQRGDGVFDSSIAGLQLLNSLGYGHNPKLPLHLVYNPLGAHLPPAQNALEADYKRELKRAFGIEFNNLFALANLPIARFATQLRRDGALEPYLQLLEQNFNAATIPALMCRTTINVGWTGEVYDCDFNGMLNLNWDAPKLWDVDLSKVENRAIATGKHCFGCTAGAGSSCGGALA
jgi:radical SAM/Cys-rich protein